MLEVVDRRGAVDKPRAVLTLDDLKFVSVDDELAHHGAHHVVDRDDADDQGVLVENDGEVGAGALEDVEHFGKRQAVRNEGAGLDDAGLLEGDRLVVEDLSQDVHAVDVADDVVEVLVADEEAVVRDGGDLDAYLLLGVVEREEDDVLARRHGRGHEAAFKVEHVLDDGFLLRSKHAGGRGGADARENVLGRDRVLTLRREAERAHQRVGELFKHEDERAQELDHDEGRTDDGHGRFLGLGDGKALREQVREDHEEKRGEYEGDDEVDAVNLFGGEHEREAPLEERREGGFADDAAEKGEGVRADLDGGEELAGMFLQVEDESGAAVAVVRKYVESGAASGGEGDFSATQKGAETDEDEKGKQLCVNGHKSEREFEESAIVTRGFAKPCALQAFCERTRDLATF